MRHFLFSAFALLLLAPSPEAIAQQVTYSYEGPFFTSFVPPYTANDRVIGWFSVPSPLPPSLPMTFIGSSLLDFTFVDGIATRSITNSTVCMFSVSTDERGDIVDWAIGLREEPFPGTGEPQHLIDVYEFFGDLGGVGAADSQPCGGVFMFSSFGQVMEPGNWTSERGVLEVPSASAGGLSLFSLLLALAGWSLIRRGTIA